MATNVSNFEDIIDSRQIIERIEELRAELDDNAEDADVCAEIRSELAPLEALAEEASGSPDWTHGETLIRDTYFEDYAQELADDIGAIDSNLEGHWPYTCIDWERAARELQQDYSSVDFDGVTYWIRE